ncbi:MAG: hypothetical protein GX025_07985 [Clostridiales bacterium]|nr:hypothetical protein [Clostridiales bacterium]
MKKLSKVLVSLCLVAVSLTLTLTPAFASFASGEITYIAFGDSVAAGVRGGVRESGSDYGYTDEIAATLKAAGVLSSFNKDFCVSGMTAKLLAENTAALIDKSSDSHKLVAAADIATLSVGANDLLAPLYDYIKTIDSLQNADITKVKEALGTVSSKVYDGVTAPQLKADIETVLQNIILAKEDIVIYVMGYYNPLPTASAALGLDMNVPLKDFNTYIQAAVADTAAKYKSASVYYVDTMAAMAADPSANLVMTDIHPTPAGYKAIAAEFWKQIEPLITAVPEPAEVTGVPTKSTVLINGQSVAFEAYNINYNNYFKLRDIAMALNSSEKQFNVVWVPEKDAIDLSSFSAYVPVGGEMALSGNTSDITAQKTTSVIYLDGQQIYLTAYKINGNNYFKLRDIGSYINFGVDWDEATSTISIDTATGYTTPLAS